MFLSYLRMIFHTHLPIVNLPIVMYNLLNNKNADKKISAFYHFAD